MREIGYGTTHEQHNRLQQYHGDEDSGNSKWKRVAETALDQCSSFSRFCRHQRHIPCCLHQQYLRYDAMQPLVPSSSVKKTAQRERPS